MITSAKFPNARPRRLRVQGWIREMVQEHRLHVSDLIMPIFIVTGENQRQPIASLPHIERYSIDIAIEEIKKIAALGIPAVALFPVVDAALKTTDGAQSYNADNLICRAVSAIKTAVPHIGIITDIALDPYTSHGHDGVLEDGVIVNDASVDILCRQALVQADAGADIIAPSDMMDGRIGAIRTALEGAGHTDTLIMSYAAKYASAFYGPFRDAVGSGPALKGDKKTYQMNPANTDAALREVALDISEGADMVMVKPAQPYLDIVRRVKDTFGAPTFAYHVSGEYAMLRAAAQNGWLDYNSCLMESLIGFKRSGADGIFTYGARDTARLLGQN